MRRGNANKTKRILVLARTLVGLAMVLLLLPTVPEGAGTQSPEQHQTQAADKSSLCSSEVSQAKASFKIDRPSVVFHDDNLKRGEIVRIDNTSGLARTLGIELPREGVLYVALLRIPEQTKVPREKWQRFVVPPRRGIFVALLPERDPASLKKLDGKEIVIRVYEANKVRETYRVPFRVALGSKSRAAPPSKATKAHPAAKKSRKKRRTKIVKQQSQSLPRSPSNVTDILDRQLREAAERGDLASVKSVIAKGAEVNTKTGLGITPLMAAARGKNLEIVKYLIDKGADLNARDEQGLTPLMYAVSMW